MIGPHEKETNVQNMTSMTTIVIRPRLTTIVLRARMIPRTGFRGDCDCAQGMPFVKICDVVRATHSRPTKYYPSVLVIGRSTV